MAAIGYEHTMIDDEQTVEVQGVAVPALDLGTWQEVFLTTKVPQGHAAPDDDDRAAIDALSRDLRIVEPPA